MTNRRSANSSKADTVRRLSELLRRPDVEGLWVALDARREYEASDTGAPPKELEAEYAVARINVFYTAVVSLFMT